MRTGPSSTSAPSPTTADHFRAFAGADVDRAKYYSEDHRFLLEFEPTVLHWEVTPDDAIR